MYCVYMCLWMCVHAVGVQACLCAQLVCLCMCLCMCVCVLMWAVTRKWLCLFKLSTLSHVGQFSGNENPTPPPPLTPLQAYTALLPHPNSKPSEWAAVFWRLKVCLWGPTVLGEGWRAVKVGGEGRQGRFWNRLKLEVRWRKGGG